MPSTVAGPAGMFEMMLGGLGIGAPGYNAGDGVAGASVSGMYIPPGPGGGPFHPGGGGTSP